MTAIGRLTMKIQCQLMAWVIAPPASRPIEPPAEATKRVDADRLHLLPLLGEHGDDHAEDDGRGERTADALDEAGDDQHGLAVGKADRPAMRR